MTWTSSTYAREITEVEATCFHDCRTRAACSMAFLLVTSAFAFSPAAHTILRQPTVAPISYQPLITAPVHAARPVPVLMTTLDPSDNSGDRFEGALLMLVVALLWGSNFPAVKATIEAGLPSSAAASMRFFVAAVALLPLLSQGPRPMPRGLVIGGLECGMWLALGYIGQALALHDLPAGAVAFLASLQVVFVPLLQAATGGGALSQRLMLAASMCIGGVGLLEMGGMSAPDLATGDVSPMLIGPTLLALLQPVGFGTSYLRIEALMKEYPEAGLQLSSLQLLSNAAIAIAWCAADANTLGGTFDISAIQQPAVIGGILYTGLISTALTVLLQTRALSLLPATDSSVIVATEPLWAAGFAFLLLNESLDPSAQLGGTLILLGSLSNTLLPDTLLPEANERRSKSASD